MKQIQAFRSAIFHIIEEKGTLVPLYYLDGLLIVKDGHIIACDNFEQIKNQVPLSINITCFPNSLIIPGFIDTHLHYPQYKIIASYGETLLQWLDKYTFIEEQKFVDKHYSEYISKLFFDEIIKNGTTTAMSFCTTAKHSVDAFFSEAKLRNMRMIGGKVVMDRNAPQDLCDSPEEGYKNSKELIKKWHNDGRLSYAITPRFAPTSTSKQLEYVSALMAEYRQNGVLLQTHLNENRDEIAWVRQLFPKSKSYFDVYDSYELTGESSVFGHCIHNTTAELIKIAHTNSKIALCPRSNLFLGSGLFNLKELDEHNICYSLASDIGGGDSFSMFLVMNEAYKIAKLNGYDLTPVKAFYLATLAGAKVLGMEQYIGNLAPKTEADFLVLDLQATTLISQRLKNAQTIEDILFCLMTLGDDRVINKVFIMGKNVYNKQ